MKCNFLVSTMVGNSSSTLTVEVWNATVLRKNVKVSNDHEMAQSERNPTPKPRWETKLDNQVLTKREHIISRVSNYHLALHVCCRKMFCGVLWCVFSLNGVYGGFFNFTALIHGLSILACFQYCQMLQFKM